MTTELTPLDSLKHFNLVENGLIVTGKPTYDEWREGWRWLKRLDKALPWIVGDMLVYGDVAYSDLVHQEMDTSDDELTHFTYGTLRIYKYVSAHWPLLNRLTKVPWSYHQITAHLPMDKRIELIRQVKSRVQLQALVDRENSNRPNLPAMPAHKDDTIEELRQENFALQQRVTQLEQAAPVSTENFENWHNAFKAAHPTRAISLFDAWQAGYEAGRR